MLARTPQSRFTEDETPPHATVPTYHRLESTPRERSVTYLSAGSTNTPLVAPGLASLLHAKLSKQGWLQTPVETNSNSGICTSGAQALVNACRAVSSGEHSVALCVGVEQPSAILKSSVVRPPYDLWRMLRDVKRSRWFMTVFLRFMLSDGAGAWLVEDRPSKTGLSF